MIQILQDRIIVFRRDGAAHRVRVRKFSNDPRVFAIRCHRCDEVMRWSSDDLGAFVGIEKHRMCEGRLAYSERRCAELITAKAPGGYKNREVVMGTRLCRSPLPCPVHKPKDAGTP
jgi:hypothetical protein